MSLNFIIIIILTRVLFYHIPKILIVSTYPFQNYIFIQSWPEFILSYIPEILILSTYPFQNYILFLYPRNCVGTPADGQSDRQYA